VSGLPTLLFPEEGELRWRPGSVDEASALLAIRHYLGPIDRALHVVVGVRGAVLVACQVWDPPTSRRLPADGSWVELSRWCLTPEAGKDAGTRMHAWAVRWLRREAPRATTLVSYSDPSQGHTGALYRACNWSWAPTWHRLRPPPTGQGDWGGAGKQEAKDRWVFALRRDARRAGLLRVDDAPAIRGFVPTRKHEAAWLRAQQVAS
jgi:hypothetical protein